MACGFFSHHCGVCAVKYESMWDTVSEWLCKGVELASFLAFIAACVMLWVGTPA